MYESLERIEQFAKDRHIPLIQNYQEQKLPTTNGAKITSTRKELYMRLHRNGREFYFGFYDSLGQSTSNKSLFSALYMVTPKEVNNVEMQKREWFDKLRMKKRFKTGNDFIDKNIIISTKPILPITRGLADDFLKMQKKYLSLRFEMLHADKHFIEGLQNKNVLSLKVIQWLSDPKELEDFLERSCRMLTAYDM